ncbi:MAG: peptidase S9 family protein [Bacteroidetes bacterium HGW-Bacteroidetes-5]|nr:MAG: peptidase S9 family protein [Bacteroidetes bacterium HGW-Bacteroidetes-5]
MSIVNKIVDMYFESLSKKFLAPFLCLIILSQQSFAQTAVQSIPSPVTWKDNDNIILLHTKGMKRVYYEYNIKKGTMVEIDSPTPPKAVPTVALKSGDIIYRDLTGLEKQITFTKDAEQNPTLSPDYKYVAFTRNNDLYSIEIATGRETRYTNDGSELILNGWASWVYFEEIFGRGGQYRAFWWSPDSRRLAFYRFDDTNVPMFPIYDAAGKHGTVVRTRYPKAGDPNPEAKLGFVAVEGGDIVWANFDPKADQYFGTPYWSNNSATVMVQWMDRDQSNLVLYGVSSFDGTMREIYKEYQKTWINWISDMKFGKLGFYFVRDFELWEHIYYQSYDGSVLERLTDGMNWGIKIINIDEESSTINFTARRDASVRNDIYRLTRDEEGRRVTKLSLGEFNFTTPLISPDGKYVVAMCSNISTPSRLVLLSAAKRGVVKEGEMRVIADSKSEDFDKQKLPVTEMIYITTSEGFRLPGSITYPLNFDKSIKYPVIVNIYGGPNSTNVMDSWRTPSKNTIMWAQEGVIQVSLDNRASGHCGKEGINYIHRNLGHYELKDYIYWAKYLSSLPYVNSEKIGITGFSYGGTMTALALTEGADYFKYGIAGAGVYHWHLYDSHYTERYMDHPDDNPEGYSSSAAVLKADKYRSDKGSLLYITHGTGDDNVHFQNTIQLVDALQKAGKQFELMIYPGGMHGYRGYQGAHSDEAINAFWRKTLLGK